MIPSGNTLLTTELEVKTLPSLNYAMNFELNRIVGKVDGLEAMRQVIYKILNTERYQYLIYSWNYGIELADLFGMPVDYCCAEIERRVVEALEADDRIDSVEDFEFEFPKPHVVTVTFTVNTIFGQTEIETEVDI